MKKRSWLLFAATILVSPCLPVAGAPDTLPSLPPETRSKLEAWYREAGGARPGEAFGSYLARVAYLEHGADYDDVVPPPGEEKLRVDLDRFECVTFIESSLAVARCGYRGDPTVACFEREIVRSRYRDGALTDYASRLHYFTDWIDDNGRRKRLENLTRELGGEPMNREFFYVGRRLRQRAVVSGNELARLESEVADTESRLSAEPHLVLMRESAPAALGKLEDGDLVAFVRVRPGLLVSHAGFIYWVNGHPRLLHASSYHHRVVLTPDDVTSYLLRRPERKGVIVARPLPP
jgi:N-acetylmuramoyl-L-alanine amidase-like